MNDFAPLRVAIVGCGNISGGYGNSLKTKPEKVKIVGAFDVDGERARAFSQRYGGGVYKSLESLLSDPEVEAVINLTSHHAHAEVSAAALSARKHVHSEKPLAGTRADGQRLLKLARERGVRLSCSPFTFLGEAQQTAWKALREDVIGKVLIAYAEMNWARIESWHPNPEGFYQVGVGPMLDVGVYALTVLTTILGPVRRVLGVADILLPERTFYQGPRKGEKCRVTTPDQITGFLTFASSAKARLTASFLGYSRQGGIEFHGEKGTLILSSSHDFNAQVETRTVEKGVWEPVPYVVEPFRGVEWGRAMFELADSLRTGAPQRVTGEQAYHVLDICLSILDSAEQERPVEVASSFTPPPPSDIAA
ncbi:Gfo/Idh/MocA family oxidoreductase [Candidatus Poribacteria bacterium]|nr:Gfo/Idh/MocA family oxidoreductase [Candidatus Poribacteria bacterium]